MPALRSLIVALMFPMLAAAEDWPQWLGPRRDGSSAEKIAAWKEPLKVLWKQPVGEGHSSPVVAGGRVFLHTKDQGTNDEIVAAYDAATGKPAWTKKYDRGAFKSLFGNGPRGTPAVVDGKVYTFGITGMLTCLKADTGDQVWQVDTLKEFGAKNLFFGISGSPLIDGDRILLNIGGKGAGIVAFDKESGKTLWKQFDDKASYASGNLFGSGDSRQAVFLTGNRLVSVSPKDGTMFWQFPLVDKLSESSTTPIQAGDIVVGSSITYGCVGMKVAGAAKPTAEKAWMNDKLTCYFSTPVAVGKDHLYVVTGTKPPALFTSATLYCIDAATGNELWKREKVGKYHASLLRTADNKLLLLEEAGDLVLFDADPKEYRELARSKISGNTWAHPALSQGRVYIRDNKDLICVQVQ